MSIKVLLGDDHRIMREGLRILLEKESDILKVLALSMHTDQRFVEGMLRAGARGYLPKDCASEENHPDSSKRTKK